MKIDKLLLIKNNLMLNKAHEINVFHLKKKKKKKGGLWDIKSCSITREIVFLT